MYTYVTMNIYFMYLYWVFISIIYIDFLKQCSQSNITIGYCISIVCICQISYDCGILELYDIVMYDIKYFQMVGL